MRHIIQIEAVIFDLDGVIVHTDIYHYKAWKQIADMMKLPFDEEVNHKLRGVSRMDSLEIILENAGITLPAWKKDELADKKNEIYKTYLMSMQLDDIASEVLDTLNRLKHQGYKMAIGSSSRNAKLILERVGLNHFFDAISDGNNISRSKPDPEVFLKAAEYLGKNPDCCVIVEDAAAGIEAGTRAGMKTVAVGDAVRSGYSDYNAEKFSDIPHIIKRINDTTRQK